MRECGICAKRSIAGLRRSSVIHVAVFTALNQYQLPGGWGWDFIKMNLVISADQVVIRVEMLPR